MLYEYVWCERGWRDHFTFLLQFSWYVCLIPGLEPTQPSLRLPVLTKKNNYVYCKISRPWNVMQRIAQTAHAVAD